MTWFEFNTAVRVHLTTHNRRQGVQTLIDALIKAAVADLQSAVPSLREGHKCVYLPSRFTTEGSAGRAHFPPGAVVTAVYARDPDDHATMFDFTRSLSQKSDREMVEGLTGLSERKYSLDGAKGVLRVVPNPKEDTSEVVVIWNGKKLDYDADDEVAYDETVVLAVAEFVLARLARGTVQDVELARSYAGSYAALKRRIKSDANEAR